MADAEKPNQDELLKELVAVQRDVLSKLKELNMMLCFFGLIVVLQLACLAWILGHSF